MTQENALSTTETYMRQAQAAFADMANSWFQPTKTLFESVPTTSYGLLNPTEAFAQMSRVSQRLAEVNLEYLQNLAGAVRQHVTGLASVLNDEMTTTAKVATAQVEKFEEAAADQADEIQRAERAAVRRARKAARDAAAERYQDMTKVELSEELGARDLPKSGNVDELRGRLTEADLQGA
jgi:hypothetical protein